MRSQVQAVDSRGLLGEEHSQPGSDAVVHCRLSGTAHPGSSDEPLEAIPSTAPANVPHLNVGHYLILISLNCIGAFSSDCYIPNLSDIVDDLATTDQKVSLTIQINWYLLGIATPIVGHLSDMYGRKLVINIMLVIYMIGTIAGAFAPTIEWLLVARCVQGIGESVSIITSSIIRDVVDDKQKRMRVQAYFTTMRPLMLLGGPSIGGLIGSEFGWRNLMKGLSAWGALTMALMQLVPESNASCLPPSAASSTAATMGSDEAALPKPRRCTLSTGIGRDKLRRFHPH